MKVWREKKGNEGTFGGCGFVIDVGWYVRGVG